MFLNGLMSVTEEENTKKFGQLLEWRISGTARPIPFKFDTYKVSLALPDPLRTGAYRLEIISAMLEGLVSFTGQNVS